MMNGIEIQVQYILAAITKRYVITENKIPPDILKLKDEAMDIFEKSKTETKPKTLAKYERRLGEIREKIDKNNG